MAKDKLLQLIEDRGYYRGALDTIKIMEAMHQPYPQTKQMYIERIQSLEDKIKKLGHKKDHNGLEPSEY